MPLSEARKTANKNWDARNIEKTNAIKLACYYRHRDVYLSRQRERYHEKKAQKRDAERQVRFLEEARIEQALILAAPYTTQTPAISV
jgi:hypothetical protein